MVSDRQLSYWFGKYNRLYFGGQLPPTIIFFEPPPGAYAQTCQVFETPENKFLIKIDPAVKGFHKYLRQLILHEMVHVKLWKKHPRHQHGKIFNQEMLRLVNEGALKGLW